MPYYMHTKGKHLMNTTDIRANARHAANALLTAERGTGALIALQDLYEACEAGCATAQNGVRWAVLDAKQAGIITKTDKRGLYATAFC